MECDTPILAVHHVSHVFKEKNATILALSDVNLTVRKGEILSIVGPSGCGKTTLLHILAGILPPSEGEVCFLDHSDRALRALVPQTESIFPWLSVEDNVAFSIGKTAANHRAAIHSYLDQVGLLDFAKAWPRQLSGGMKKRVELARAFAAEPSVILMDEPFGSLDIFTREEMQVLLNRIWQSSGASVAFVTHDIEEALFVGSRVLVLSSRPGRVNKIIEVPFPSHRPLELKLEAHFIEIRREIIETLKAQPKLEEANPSEDVYE